MMYLDLDEIDTVFDPFWLWSSSGFNVAAFKRSKYLSCKHPSLLIEAQKLVHTNTGVMADKIYLLTNLAYFGYCFNPISLFFCFKGGKIIGCIAEVTNTPWGESYAYVLEPIHVKNNIYSVNFKKELFVSPFLEMNYKYKLNFSFDENAIRVNIENNRDGEKHFDATLTLNKLPITKKNMRRILVRFPFMTAKIIFSIYWQALKLLCKRIKLVRHKELR